MKEIIRYGFILGLICAIASGALAVVNSAAAPKIIAQAKAEEEASLRKVMPEGERFEPVKAGDETVYYKIFNKDGAFIGAAFKAEGRGYSGPILTMAGMAKDGIITAIKVLSQTETPGLGANIIEPPFAERFVNKNTQDLTKIQAITGATISSKAVIESVSRKARQIMALIAAQDGRTDGLRF